MVEEQAAYRRYGSVLKNRAGMEPENGRVGVSVCFPDSVHGGGTRHSTVQLHIKNRMNTIFQHNDRPIKVVTAWIGEYFACKRRGRG